MRKNNTAIILGGLFFSCSVMAGVGTLAPTLGPMGNGRSFRAGQYCHQQYQPESVYRSR